MKVIILGCKKIGMAVKEFLEDVKDIKSIICIDKRVMGTSHGKIVYKKVNLEFINASDVKGVNVLINTVRDMEKERIVKICKSARVSMIDLTVPGLSQIPRDAKDLGGRGKNWMVFGCGMSPGITNIMANIAYEEMKKTNKISSISIMLVQSREEQKYSFPFGASEAVDYALLEPIKSEKGKIEKIEDYHRVKIKVPNDEEPVGIFTFRDYYGSEIISLAKIMPDIDITYKFGGADADYLDAIRTMHSTLKEINSEEDARKKIQAFFKPVKESNGETINGVSGVYISVGDKIKGLAIPKIIKNKYKYLNYATYPMAVFVGALLDEAKNILPGAYLPENLPLDVQKRMFDRIKRHFDKVNW